MKRNFIKMLEAFEHQMVFQFPKELNTYLSSCAKYEEELFVVLWANDEFDELENLIKKLPSHLQSSTVEETCEFIFILPMLKDSLSKSSDQISPALKQRLNEFDLRDVATFINELCFFFRLTDRMSEDLPDWIKDIPVFLRHSIILDKKLQQLIGAGAILEGSELSDHYEDCLDFLEYCTEVHGLPKSLLPLCQRAFEKTFSFSEDTEDDFQISFKGTLINVKISERLFFMSYFTKVIEETYGVTQRDSLPLMAHLYDILFYSKVPMSSSLDIEDLFKKKLKRGGDTRKTKDSINKIRSLASLRVKHIRASL